MKLKMKETKKEGTGVAIVTGPVANGLQTVPTEQFGQLQPDPGVGSDVTVVLAPWFALRVRPNYEKPVATALRGKGFQEFLPLVRTRRQWSDRVKMMDLPLFPGYGRY